MERFGKFQLLEKIGVGGMAEIYLARPSDVALSKLVAVKRILPNFSKDSSFIEMFHQEGEIALRLRHPSIVTVYELGEINNQYYMSMEYFPGKTLALLVRTLRDHGLSLDLSEKFFIIKNIAEALQYIHEFSGYGDHTEIIHRDVSPQNILVGFDGGVKLIDFGVAKIIDKDSATRTAVLKGKMAYMSPEQIRGEKLTKQTDIFSLGVVLWEVLAGRKLFTGSSIEEVARKVALYDVPSLTAFDPSIPSYVDRICRRALAKHTEERYMSARELVADLDEVLKSFRYDGHQARLARTMQSIFPEDVSRLQDQLKKFEGERRHAVPSTKPSDLAPVQLSIEPPAVPKSVSKKIAPPRPPSFSTTTNTSIKRPSSSNALLVNAVVFVLGITTVLGATLLLRKESSLLSSLKALHFWPTAQERQPANDLPDTAPSTPNQPSVPAVQPAIAAPPPSVNTAQPARSIPAPAPQPAPSHSMQPSQPAYRSAPKSEPKIAAKKAETPRPKPTPSAKAHKPVRKEPVAAETRTIRTPSKAFVKHTEPLPAQSELPEQPSAPGKPSAADRKPAAQPAIKAFAYLTVFADPDAKIMVDGKIVGTEIVNDLRVPADKKIVVKVVPGPGQIGKSQQLTLRPGSHNVVDLAQQSGGSAQ